ncbi:MAG: YbhB/YbcL family Raf kinase inhibitor-like protein [Nannocystaceae bacterium]|nr:YbhB/YbcL family Raf kinase inhibitor-like protein [Nannocystaceae bacterium]
MRRLLLIGLVAGSLTACGDDGGESGDSSGSTGVDTTTDPTVDPSASTSSSSSSTDPSVSSSSTTSDESSTTAADSSSSTGADESSSSTGPGIFAVTSPSFVEGELMPFDSHICEGNIHPQLDWVSPPDGTMSYGVFFHDVSISFEHSAIWNIPADATGVPAGIEATAMPASVPGASQCSNWNNGVGYGGPGSCSNTYQFTVYALDVPNLDDEVTAASTRVAVLASLEGHMLGTATLSGQTRGALCIPNCTPVEE